MSENETPKLPETIEIVSVRPTAVDEWYGTVVRFRWPAGFDHRAFGQADHEYSRKWFAENPGRFHVGQWPHEKRLRDRVVRLVMASPEYAAFYETPRRVRCEQYEDGPPRVVHIPRWREGDFSDWDFSEGGGWIEASGR